MRYFLIIVFELLLSVVHSQEGLITKRDIQGVWGCVLIDQGATVQKDTIINPAVVEPQSDDFSKHQETTINNEFFFKGDTLWQLNYPCELYGGFPYYIQSGSLKIHYNAGVEAESKLTMLKDTLCISNMSSSTVSKFIRINAEELILKTLLSDTVNPACLFGNWRWYNFDTDGS